MSKKTKSIEPAAEPFKTTIGDLAKTLCFDGPAQIAEAKEKIHRVSACWQSVSLELGAVKVTCRFIYVREPLQSNRSKGTDKAFRSILLLFETDRLAGLSGVPAKRHFD